MPEMQKRYNAAKCRTDTHTAKWRQDSAAIKHYRQRVSRFDGVQCTQQWKRRIDLENSTIGPLPQREDISSVLPGAWRWPVPTEDPEAASARPPLSDRSGAAASARALSARVGGASARVGGPAPLVPSLSLTDLPPPTPSSYAPTPGTQIRRARGAQPSLARSRADSPSRTRARASRMRSTRLDPTTDNVRMLEARIEAQRVKRMQASRRQRHPGALLRAHSRCRVRPHARVRWKKSSLTCNRCARSASRQSVFDFEPRACENRKSPSTCRGAAQSEIV